MSKYVVMATWEDAPHLSQEEKDELWAEIPAYQRAARSKGVPQLGAGAIYPIEEEEVTCRPFDIPRYWPRAYGFDVGWNRTAALWGAWDLENDIVYLYSEYYRGQAEPSIHADAVKSRGDWMTGAIDPSARGRSVKDGESLLYVYHEKGLLLVKADNTRESGLYECHQRLSSGRMKVFSTLQHWFSEFRIYRRDEKGQVVKQNDHLMDCMRYLIMTGRDVADTEPQPADEDRFESLSGYDGRNTVTGY